MTVITVTYAAGALDGDARVELATSLTDAVQIVECGQVTEAARFGFQVQFVELDLANIAIGGQLCTDGAERPLVADIAVMDGAWGEADRTAVIENVFAALVHATRVDRAPATWWVNFRTIDDGSWGASGHPLRMDTLLQTGLFTAARAQEMSDRLGSP